MPGLSTNRFCLPALAIIAWTATLTGCASWQGPRIDPTGQRILIWPNVTPPAIMAPAPGAPTLGPPAATYATPPVVGPPVVAQPFGNVQAPPVYSDPPAAGGTVNPFAPAPAAPIFTTPAPPVIVPAPPTTAVPPAGVLPAVAPIAAVPPPLPLLPIVPAGVPNAATPLGAAAPAGVDFLRVSPGGVLAPVGSEVVLQAGICPASGYPRTNQQVVWTVDRNGVGQFGDLGGREPLYSFSRWNAARLLDPWNAVGATTNVPFRLTRGTPEPYDDVAVGRGDAWVTVTSATEGTSHVAAIAPGLASLNRAVATIYWVDAQWFFPPSVVVAPGQPHTLTTAVTRRTDNAPLAGWLVRYDVAIGASLGYEGGNSVEVPTDANGRASVEVSPMSPSGGATNVVVTVVRPATAGLNASPRFEVGRGGATITWGAGAAVPPIAGPVVPGQVSPPIGASPYSSPPVTSPPATPPPFASQPAEPRPTLPSGPPAADPYTPPANEPSVARPQLELRLRRTGPEQVGVGEYVNFEVTITNRGAGTARGIRVRDRFDTGLRHPSAKANEYAVEYPGVRDLPPNETTTVPLTFQVVAGGTHCHEVTVSAEGADSVSERGCISARQAALEVTVTAPRTRVVGEVAEFNIVVKNTGEVAATGVELVNRYDAALEPSQAPAGHERLADGGILLRLDRLEPNERRTISTTAVCRAQSNRACNRAIVTADGGITAAAEGCVEILPALSGQAGGAAPPPLKLSVTESKNLTRPGERQIIYVTLESAAQKVEREVTVRVLLPQEFTADPAQIQPQQGLSVVGQELRFAVGELAPQQPVRITIPVTANRAGSVQVRAAALAAGMATPVSAESNPIEIQPGTL